MRSWEYGSEFGSQMQPTFSGSVMDKLSKLCIRFEQQNGRGVVKEKVVEIRYHNFVK